MKVDLSYSEILSAVNIAGQMQVQNMMQGRKPRYGAPSNFGTATALCLVGLIGELAVAKAMNKFWMGNIGHHGTTDVGGQNGFEVRTFEDENKNLILHPHDADEKKFVAASVQNLPQVNLIGWCYGHEGKHPLFWQEFTGRPCYFMPKRALRPMDTILDDPTTHTAPVQPTTNPFE